MIFLGFLVVVFGLHHIPSNEIEPELKPFVTRYHSLVDSVCPKNYFRDPVRVSIKFDDIKDSNVIGLCKITYNSAKIYIDRSFWNTYSFNERYSLIMHEMTHCFMTKNLLAGFPFHQDDPLHYMYAYNVDIPVKWVDEQLLEAARSKCDIKTNRSKY